ncbi:uncharacterized protein LOC119610826 [Lucilia sericata]|uniref:uncharacterized protein LOC119610826 n=1 Tax=Lucilia sericata TaxID=13632 RepID=UPI0018A8722D|nr:uncharacterized protein LOC119610826 [Lucilia sericata]XP_037822139.1 uncharacterized protein LOC119610826 [Lucilia sericata]
MEFNVIESKNETWNPLNQDLDIGETLINILNEVRSLKKQSEKRDEENKQLIQTLKREMQQLKSEIRALNTNVDPEFEHLPKLPINTMEDLKEFDDKLPLDDELRSELKKFIQRFDGKDYAAFLRTGLRAILTDELAVNLTWRGTQEKPSIQTFTVFVLLRDICQLKYPHINQMEINRVCQQHVLHAKDRISKRKSAVEQPTTPTFTGYSHTIRPMPPDLQEPIPSPPSPPVNLPSLPFKTLQNLEEFDDQLLENTKLKKVLKQYVNKISAKDYAHFVRGAFRAVMTDKVAMDVTWRGTKDKQSIQEFTTFVVIRDACRAKFPKVTNSDISKVCQQYFLHAKDRLKKKSRFSLLE